jgi:cell division septation protein DedD
MLVGRPKRLLVAGALVGCALALAGCSTSIADLPIVGTPADAPARPKEQGSFLPVNTLPPDRDETAMDEATRARLKAELAAARDRQAAAAAANATPVDAPK